MRQQNSMDTNRHLGRNLIEHESDNYQDVDKYNTNPQNRTYC